MKRMLFIDADSCTGCLSCVTVCSQRNEGMSAPSRSRVYVELNPFIGLYRPQICLQCVRAPCAEVCPVGAIRQEPGRGYWFIDYDVCIGCKDCVTACPLGVMFFDPIGEKVLKCETCQEDPACAKVCPTQAIAWGDMGERENYRKRKARQ